MARVQHCYACGEGVESYEVDLGTATEVRCLRCGLPLARKSQDVEGRFRRILVADDSAFFTDGLCSFLLGSDLAGEVITASDGAQALECAVRGLKEALPPELVILDLLMPRLDGLHTAVALRALERGFGADRASILFLSTRKIDPSLKPLLGELTPAYYLNKGQGGELLGQRLEEVLRAIGPHRRAGGDG